MPRLGALLCGLILLFATSPAPSGGALASEAPSGPVASYARALPARAASEPCTDAVRAGGEVRCPAASHYDVVALRVEFQPDTTRFTTGDGTFEGVLFDGLTPTIDPLPHDAAFFEAHLAFLEDYIAHVSDGRTRVATHLVPEVVRVSRPMASYSPTGFESDSDAELARLAALVEEAWRLASEQSSFDLSAFDPERTAFVLYHAGVGRDLELVGTTLDKTPQDLPSLYFDGEKLDHLLGGAPISFNGFPVRNSIVLPRTETRQGYDYVARQPFLLELTTNGLLAASFLNYLGVPDLFDTETGESAIGPFGVMDPLGFFAYRGLLPPEPSAWTRAFLGWSDPVRVDGAGPQAVELAAVGSETAGPALRVDVSPTEYFLVENRHRDPEGDGLTLRIWKDGALHEQHFENGDETFNEATVEGFLGGVLVGADDYDWALPGGLDEEGRPLLGGALIWHVDEQRLRARLDDNRVNADAERRAIDLEEADAAQDLGFPSNSIFGPQAHEGTPFDFYFEGNPVRVVNQFGTTVRLYENRFGPDTYPDSRSNGGGPSFVVVRDFSAPGPVMHFVVERLAQAGIAQGPAGTLRCAGPGVVQQVGGESSLLRLSVDPSAPPALFAASGAACGGQLWPLHPLEGRFEDAPSFASAVRPARAADGLVNGVSFRDGKWQLTAQRFAYAPAQGWSATGPAYEPALQADAEPLGPVVVADGRAYAAFREENRARLFSWSEDGGVEEHDVRPDAVALAAVDGQLAVVGRSGVDVGGEERWSYTLPAWEGAGSPAFGRDAGGLVGVVPVPGARTFLWLLPEGEVREVAHGVALGSPAEQASPAPLRADPVLVDLDADGHLDVLVAAGERLLAFTQGGAMMAGFPIRLAAAVTAQPLVAALTESGGWSVFVGLADGYLHALDLGADGATIPGFPLAVGAPVTGTPLLTSTTLTAAGADGAVRSWSVEGIGEIWWGEQHGGPANARYVRLEAGSEPEPASGALLVAEETYNWPNPIRDGQTWIRLETTQAARVTVSIVDPAGAHVDEFVLDRVLPGTPVEQLWQTDAASGLYLARVTATADDGDRETRIIKMAVIR